MSLFIYIKSLLFLYCIYENYISWFLGTLLNKSVLLLLTLVSFLNRSRRCQQTNPGRVAIYISTTYLMCVLSYEAFPLGFKITTCYKTLITVRNQFVGWILSQALLLVLCSLPCRDDNMLDADHPTFCQPKSTALLSHITHWFTLFIPLSRM